MTYNVPVKTNLISTDIVDPTAIWDNTVKQDYPADTEVKYNTGIYLNATKGTISVLAYNSMNTYQDGDFILKDGLVKVKTPFSGAVPKAPKDYMDGTDATMDNTAWTKRYTKIADFTSWSSNGMTIQYNDGTHNNYHQIYPHASSPTGWYYVTTFTEGVTVHKLTANAEVLESLSSGTVEQIPIDSAAYDFPGYWAGQTVIIDATGVYVRTDVTADIEAVTGESFTFETAVSPEDIGFSYYHIDDENSPFDDKQYTSVIRSSSQQWVVSADAYFDCIALGRLRADSVDVVFKDADGVVVSTVQGKDVNDTIDAYIEPEPTTEFVYAGSVIGPGGRAEISINSAGLDTEAGIIFAAKSIKVGATNLEFAHDVKNFDRDQVSPISGYIDHIKGHRVLVHRGSYDIQMTDYDKWVLLNKKMTQELIGIDGSDMTANEAADGVSRFKSTRIIGRIEQMKMGTTIKNGEMENVTPISYMYKEIV